MKALSRNGILFTLVVALPLVAAPAGSLAQDYGSQAPKQQQAPKEEGKRSAPVMDETTGKRMNEAIEFLNAGKHDAAAEVLKKLNVAKLSPYEQSRLAQIQASIAHAKEDFDGARKYLQQAIAAGGLNEVEMVQIKYQIAQLYMAEERWKEGAAALEEWFKSAPSPNSSAYYLLAVAYYQMEDFNRALPPAQKAIEISEKPQESWLQLLLAIYLQKEDYKSAIPILQKMIAASPDKKAYWMQLSSVYGQLENYQMSLAILELAHAAGLLTDDSEFRRLSDLLVFSDIPYRGARVLEDAIAQKKVTIDSKVYEKLANAWISAREYDKSIAPLRRAAEMSGNGELFVRLGEVEVQRREWDAAADAIRQGLDKGGLKDPGNAQLLMGITLYNKNQHGPARDWFVRASQSQKHRQVAQSYIQAIDTAL
jgi:tetratricopeptide (TPR) repeat protein